MVLEGPGPQPRARRELGVGALGTTVGRLDGAEELLLQLVRVLVIELLVRLSQGRHRLGDLVDRNRQIAQYLLSSFGGCVGHSCEVSSRSCRKCDPWIVAGLITNHARWLRHRRTPERSSKEKARDAIHDAHDAQ